MVGGTSTSQDGLTHSADADLTRPLSRGVVFTMDQVLELGGTTVRPVEDVVAIRPRGRSVAAREAAALVAEE